MECSKCGNEINKATTTIYYWTPILSRYKNARNEIISEYNKEDKRAVPISICDNCLQKRLKVHMFFYIAASLSFLIAGIVWLIFSLSKFDLSNEDHLIGFIFMNVVCFGFALLQFIFALRYKSKKSINREITRMTSDAAYKRIFIPNGGSRAIVMWSD